MFNNEQENAFNIMKSGKNVFLTGDAGTGKSYVLNEYIKYCESKFKNIVVTAPTGMAAINIKGVTLHRALSIPTEPLVEKIKELPDVLKYADVFVIDEISMCRIDLFDYIAKVIFIITNHRRKRGMKDIQIILTGDFFQLPPVITERDKEILEQYYGRKIKHGFAFQSQYWKNFNFINIVLKTIVRQDNLEFSRYLNMARMGNFRALKYFNDNSKKTEIENAVFLCGTNKMVKAKNELEYNKIDNPEFIYEAKIEGELNESDKAVDDELKLKVGTRVMTMVNDIEERYMNGSLGTILELNDNIIVVKMDNGETVSIHRYKWVIEEYCIVKDNSDNIKIEKKEIASFEQFPLKLAYAITIHKSQGQTYDAVNLSPYCWDCGQLYVALSRVRNINSLHLTQFIKNNFLISSIDVINFYRKIDI